MTEQNLFQIGASSKKEKSFDRKEYSAQRNGNRKFGNNSRNNNFNNRRVQKRSGGFGSRNQQQSEARGSSRNFRQRSPLQQRNRDNRRKGGDRRPFQRKPSGRRPFNDKTKPIKKEWNDKPKRQLNETKQQRPRDQLQKAQKQSNKPQKSQNKQEQHKKQQKKPKRSRIIIRNLVFDINEKHLRKLLAPYGQILQVNIPTNPDGKGSRGFAFVQFANRNHCLKAIKDLNGTTYKGRQIVLDESVSKERFLESKVTDEQKKEDQNDEAQNPLKNNLKQEEGEKIEEENQNEKSQQLSENVSNSQNQDQSQDEEQENQVKFEKIDKKKQKSEAQILEDISSQIFIRNLPINVTEQQLHTFFRRYGKLKFAKIVINKQTGLSKGSAFLKFQDPKVAKQLFQYSRNYEMNLLGKNSNFKLNPAINLQLEGTVLKLFPVESRTGVSQKIKARDEKQSKRKEEKQNEKKKKPIKKVKSIEKLVQYDPNDKRNLKLALLGLNKVTEHMREKDQQRFMTHERQKLEKLKNPNNSVSDKRIIFKYLNKDITEEDIRNLCLEYLEESEHRPQDLTYCKLMLESLESKKSAGYSFVEFKTHQIALGFLEWISQEPTRLMKGSYICQFSIQDSRKLMKLQNRNKPKPQRTERDSKKIKKSRVNGIKKRGKSNDHRK